MQRHFDDSHGTARLLWPALILLTLAALALAPKPAHGAPNQCTLIVPQGAREVMVNTCNACRSVDIMRRRPGNEVPVRRTFTLPPGSRLEVPFLGPGRSRITSEMPCPGAAGAAPNIVKTPELIQQSQQKQPETCVALQRLANGVALLNSCGACRAALVERVNGPNGGNARQAYKLGPHSVVAVASDGFAQVGLIGDIACP